METMLNLSKISLAFMKIMKVRFCMYWNGEKEVTKEEVRAIYDKELRAQNVREMWTNHPEDFERRELCPTIAIISSHTFQYSELIKCYDDDECTMYADILTFNTAEEANAVFNSLKCIYKDGRWLDAN